MLSNKITLTLVIAISGILSSFVVHAGQDNFTKTGDLLSYTGGDVGIGTSSPERLLHLEGNVAKFSRNINSAGFIIQHTGDGGVRAVFGQDIVSGSPRFVLKNIDVSGLPTIFNVNLMAPNNSFYLDDSGNIGLGTTKTTDGYKLSVAGNMRAESLNVSLNSKWADYVFKDNYKLMALKDVETYIDDNGHLPGVPSASDVAKEGVNIGDMTKTLLEKVEELTLHMIELKKENEILKEKMAAVTIQK